MSIINDALKKTQNTLGNKEEKPIISAAPPTPDKKNDQFSFLAILIVAIGFIGCVAVVVLLLRPADNKASSTQALVETQLPKEIVPRPTATTAKASQGLRGLTLNGISTVDGKHIAVINNKIVNDGDSFGERKVLGIEADAVKIYDNGEVLILKMAQ